MTPSASITVSLGQRSYDVHVGAGILAALGDRCAEAVGRGGRAFLVYDDKLSPALVDEVLGSLSSAGFDVAEESMRAGEGEKTLDTVARLLAHIASTRHERRDPVIALGGGIVGDTAGFAAAAYRRGVPFIQCPTTRLAMVDASVGGKTGVNLAIGGALKKNMVGAFWQPRLVMADVAALRSLPDREFRAGLAECLKHGLIAGTVGAETNLFEWTCGRLGSILPSGSRDEAAVADLVRRNVAVKARVVEGDEREEAPSSAPGGGRALLNLGHTFAHAIETMPGVAGAGAPVGVALLHGEAVGIGLCAAAATAEAMRMLDSAAASAIRAAVKSAGLPVTASGLPADEAILEAMAHDKKTAGGRLRLVLPTDLGQASVVEDPPPSAVRAGISAIRV